MCSSSGLRRIAEAMLNWIPRRRFGTSYVLRSTPPAVDANGDRIEGLRKETYAEPVASGGSIHERAGPSFEGGNRATEGSHPGLERGITEHVKFGERAEFLLRGRGQGG